MLEIKKNMNSTMRPEGKREQEILETLIALLGQCDELLQDLEHDLKYDELVRTTRAAYGKAIAAYLDEIH